MIDTVIGTPVPGEGDDLDFRIRLTAKVRGKRYRVVAPSGRTLNGRFFNDDPLVIEYEDKDAMGVLRWAHAFTFSADGFDDPSSLDSINILYHLINGSNQ